MAKGLGIAPDRERAVVALVLLLFVCLATVYSLATPIFEGYDEKWHYAYVQHIHIQEHYGDNSPQHLQYCTLTGTIHTNNRH